MRILLFLMSIESRLGKSGPATFKRQKRVVDKETGKVKYVDFKPDTKADYEKPTTPLSEYERVTGQPTANIKKGMAKEEPSITDKVKGFAANLANIPKNAYDTTVGYVDAKYLNWQTKRVIKKEPNRKVLYMMHGVDQSIGSQRKLARQTRDDGEFMPYLLGAKHSEGPKKVADNAFKQIGSLHKKAGIKNAYMRNDKYTGHSSGGNAGLYMATDPRINKYGIKEVHAVAPTPHGLKPRTLGQRLIGAVADITPEDIRHRKGQETMTELYKRGQPHVPVYVSAGKFDRLVPPSDAAYQHAAGVKIIKHQDSTHFGTSGVNPKMNHMILNLIKNPNLYDHKETYKKAA